MDAAGVGEPAHGPAQGVQLPHHVALAHPADAGVAAHLADLVQVHGQEGRGPCPCGRRCARPRCRRARLRSPPPACGLLPGIRGGLPGPAHQVDDEPQPRDQRVHPGRSGLRRAGSAPPGRTREDPADGQGRLQAGGGHVRQAVDPFPDVVHVARDLAQVLAGAFSQVLHRGGGPPGLQEQRHQAAPTATSTSARMICSQMAMVLRSPSRVVRESQKASPQRKTGVKLPGF